MALGRESNPLLDSAFRDLRELKVDVAYPILLEVYHDYTEGLLSAADLEQAVRLNNSSARKYLERKWIGRMAPSVMNFRCVLKPTGAAGDKSCSAADDPQLLRSGGRQASPCC